MVLHQLDLHKYTAAQIEYNTSWTNTTNLKVNLIVNCILLQGCLHIWKALGLQYPTQLKLVSS